MNAALDSPLALRVSRRAGLRTRRGRPPTGRSRTWSSWRRASRPPSPACVPSGDSTSPDNRGSGDVGVEVVERGRGGLRDVISHADRSTTPSPARPAPTRRSPRGGAGSGGGSGAGWLVPGGLGWVRPAPRRNSPSHDYRGGLPSRHPRLAHPRQPPGWAGAAPAGSGEPGPGRRRDSPSHDCRGGAPTRRPWLGHPQRPAGRVRDGTHQAMAAAAGPHHVTHGLLIRRSRPIHHPDGPTCRRSPLRAPRPHLRHHPEQALGPADRPPFTSPRSLLGPPPRPRDPANEPSSPADDRRRATDGLVVRSAGGVGAVGLLGWRSG